MSWTGVAEWFASWLLTAQQDDALVKSINAEQKAAPLVEKALPNLTKAYALVEPEIPLLRQAWNDVEPGITAALPLIKEALPNLLKAYALVAPEIPLLQRAWNDVEPAVTAVLHLVQHHTAQGMKPAEAAKHVARKIEVLPRIPHDQWQRWMGA